MLRSLPAALVVSAVVTQIAIFTTTIWLHRTLSHRAITMAPGVTMVFRVITWVSTGLRPREWVAVHRLHHAHTDEEGDPHSPRLLSFLKVQLGNAYLYRRVATKPPIVAKYAKDLKPDKWDKRFFDRSLVGLSLGIAFLILVLGVGYGLLAAGVHAVMYLLLSGAVNAVGHVWGKRPHPNWAGNSQWLAWLTAGEGLHNNHHAMPTAARLAFSRREIDPGWWVVRLLERAGWATVRLQPALVKARQAA
jgi:stearoyl-CoA desaturase (delta-9 desaturase)